MTWATVLQLLAAAGLGAAIGLERELSAQPAGLRTHMLVALGAALFTLVGTQLVGADPTRIAAQVVTGIGFLGGGAIFREGTTPRGLTTAASLWVTAAIGLAIGLRAWGAAGVTALVALVVLGAIRQIERRHVRRQRGLTATITLTDDASIDQVEQAVRQVLPRVATVRVSYRGGHHSLSVTTWPTPAPPIAQLAERLRRTPGVAGVDLAP